jgi:hypothetical protein
VTTIGYELRSKDTGEAVEPTRWGDWELDRERLVLVNEKEDYEVDLERCLSAGETLDWIIQISSKIWGTDECVGSLVAALRDLLDPQSTLTHGKNIAPSKVKGLVANREVNTLAYRESDRRHSADSDGEGFRVTSLSEHMKEHAELTAAYEVVDPDAESAS